MNITERDFGSYSSGRQGRLITIRHESGACASFTDFGASITGVTVPDRNGAMGDVVLGYPSAADYERHSGAFGSVCGRFANRLRGSRIKLNGVEFPLDANSTHFTIHGGSMGFQKQVWDYAADGSDVVFSLTSPDGDMGFPGELRVQVRYSFSDDCVLTMALSAVSSADTVINLTNHAYFNLSGHASADEHQLLRVNSRFFNPQDSDHLPTGEVRLVDGTPFDFREYRDVFLSNASDCEQIAFAGGIDHNFLLSKTERGAMEYAGSLYSRLSGRLMEVYTTQPAMMVYTANAVSEREGKDGAVYSKRCGVCMETHYVPDSMAHTHFPCPILLANEEYQEITQYRFSTAEV